MTGSCDFTNILTLRNKSYNLENVVKNDLLYNKTSNSSPYRLRLRTL